MVERVIIEENPFPSDLEERLAAILNVVNTEYKSLTTLFGLDTEHFRDKGQIRREIVRAIGSPSFLPKSTGNFRYYCEDSLHPIGCVAKEIIISEGEVTLNPAYKLTEAGFFYGQPIAAFSLYWVYNNKRSLYGVLGSTKSETESRAPYNRIRILEALKKGELRERDLEELLEIVSSGIIAHCSCLKKIGFINFDSVGETNGRGEFLYELVDPDSEFDEENYREWLKKISKEMTLLSATKDVFCALKSKGRADYQELSRMTGYCSRHVYFVLSNLENVGIVKKAIMWRASEIKSNISSTDDGRRFLEEYVEPLRDVLSNGNWLNIMSLDYLDRLMNDREERMRVCQEAAKTYYEISPCINSKGKEKRFKEILNLVENGVITSKRISERLNVSRNTARVLLSKMERVGLLTSI